MTTVQGASPGKAVFRFAPSPNGYLHLGHAYSALLNHAAARAAKGTMLLRLEDIDRERCREAYAEAIVDDMRWLGIAWEGTPRRQSEHFAAYRAALDTLARRGLVYPCFCSRGAASAAAAAKAAREGGAAAARDPDGAPLYPGTCRRLSADERARRVREGRPAALRLDMARACARIERPVSWEEQDEAGPARLVAAEPAAWGDAILARRDTPTSYHLSVVTDDAAQGVTDVVRGQDLFHATSLHRLLQELLALPAPRYRHHRLILDANGRKLSKSGGAPSLRALRGEGTDAGAVRRALGLA